MDPIARKADGRRVYAAEFKREQIERVLRGELTLAELSRELEISRNLLARWKSLITAGGETAVAANEASLLRRVQEVTRRPMVTICRFELVNVQALVEEEVRPS